LNQLNIYSFTTLSEKLSAASLAAWLSVQVWTNYWNMVVGLRGLFWQKNKTNGYMFNLRRFEERGMKSLRQRRETSPILE